jgi:hypothetical protein
MKQAFLFLLVLAFGTLSVLALGEETYTVNGWKLGVTLVPEKTVIMVGEPIQLSFDVRNYSTQDLQVIDGGCTSMDFNLGRPKCFSVQVSREDGTVLPARKHNGGGNSLEGPQKIAANDIYRSPLLRLSDWAALMSPGTYIITAKRRLSIGKYNPKVFYTQNEQTAVDAQASAKIAVTASPQ